MGMGDLDVDAAGVPLGLLAPDDVLDLMGFVLRQGWRYLDNLESAEARGSGLAVVGLSDEALADAEVLRRLCEVVRLAEERAVVGRDGQTVIRMEDVRVFRARKSLASVFRGERGEPEVAPRGGERVAAFEEAGIGLADDQRLVVAQYRYEPGLRGELEPEQAAKALVAAVSGRGPRTQDAAQAWLNRRYDADPACFPLPVLEVVREHARGREPSADSLRALLEILLHRSALVGPREERAGDRDGAVA
jgi:hypothetical protein